MRKTNIRINNLFVIEDNGKHYLSEINEPDKWIGMGEEELEIIGDEITEDLMKLLNEYEISSNVNFCDFDFNVEGGGSS